MINKIILGIAVFLAALLIAAYTYYFKFEVGLNLSKNPEHWVWAADFFSGILGTLFTFISVVFLIHTIGLQNKANLILEKDSKDSELKRKMEVFELQFFNLIDAQRAQFEATIFPLSVHNAESDNRGSKGVCLLEDLMEDEDLDCKINLIKQADIEDSIYSTVRSFFVITKTIDKHLSDDNGFSENIRKDYYETLVHFTNFAQLRVILIAMRYTNTYASNSLMNNPLFRKVLVDLDYDDYLKSI